MPFTPQVTNILLVDDEAVVRYTVSAILTAQSFNVRAVASVSEALEMIPAKKFDLLVSDLNIAARHDGLDVVGAMHREQPECLTFIMTATPDLESLLWAIRNKVDDYFLKISDEGLLGAKLMAHLAVTPPPRRQPPIEGMQYKAVPEIRPLGRPYELHLVPSKLKRG